MPMKLDAVAYMKWQNTWIIETPDEKYCFKHATCWLPDYTCEDIFHYSDEEMDKFDEIVHSMAHLIMEFSQEGGFDNASNF